MFETLSRKEHDPNKPLQFWFQESCDGPVLFIVFYTLACRYGKCVGCSLFMKESSQEVSHACLMNQIDSILHEPEVAAKRDDIRKVIVSNNGSILDQQTFSSTALMYLIATLHRSLPNLDILSLETRIEHVDNAELEFLSRAKSDVDLSIIEFTIGFEAFSEEWRNVVYRKGLQLVAFEDFVKRIAHYGCFDLKCYFMLKPVAGVTNEAAVEDIRAAIRYLSRLASQYHLMVNLHLNPTYVAKDSILEPSFHDGSYTPPSLHDVIHATMAAEDTPLTVFLGLYDEGFAVEGGSFIKPGEASGAF